MPEEEMDWNNYESGPFCPHWGSPGDCDELCVRCGHTCTAHGSCTDLQCDADDCNCVSLLLETD